MKIAVFPLPLVLFPEGFLPLRIFEARYLDMVADCLKNKKKFAVIPVSIEGQMEANITATTAEIISWDHGESGTLNIIVKGISKVNVTELSTTENGLGVAKIKTILDEDTSIEDNFRYFHDIIRELSDNNLPGHFEGALNSSIFTAYRVAEFLELNIEEKLAILKERKGSQKISALEKILKDNGNIEFTNTLH
ncbi:LON peptidase substrate-binding domain-containing protein [Pseudomonadota bacterium]|nr:LON peptidase substrate-binding domain-containing protein [Pseudomonadota bacterium]|tara:strand:+ start:1486 stop:2064 length:579 start_codon:yes stop_codon:yes gene_type:complete